MGLYTYIWYVWFKNIFAKKKNSIVTLDSKVFLQSYNWKQNIHIVIII